MGAIAGILDLLFPPRCVFCRKFLKTGEKDICGKCRESLPVCPAEKAVSSGEFYDICVSPLYYKDDVRRSILRFKFNDATNYASCYGKILAECIKDNLAGKYDMITWVPVSKEREKKRGYDQAMLLALATALELDDVAVETLRKTKDIPAQSTLDGHEERKANVVGVYEATDRELINDKRILVIDDIVTTGSTLSECARTLLMAGAREVICATLARTE